MTIQELEIEIQNKLGNENFTLNDALNNPETYGLSQFDVKAIQNFIENNDELSEEQSEDILGLFKIQEPIIVNITENSSYQKATWSVL